MGRSDWAVRQSGSGDRSTVRLDGRVLAAQAGPRTASGELLADDAGDGPRRRRQSLGAKTTTIRGRATRREPRQGPSVRPGSRGRPTTGCLALAVRPGRAHHVRRRDGCSPPSVSKGGGCGGRNPTKPSAWPPPRRMFGAAVEGRRRGRGERGLSDEPPPNQPGFWSCWRIWDARQLVGGVGRGRCARRGLVRHADRVRGAWGGMGRDRTRGKAIDSTMSEGAGGEGTVRLGQ